MTRNGLERVTKASPCAICGKPDYCCRLSRYHWCMRIENGKPHEKGGWLHKRGQEGAVARVSLPKRKVAPDEEMRAQWEPIAHAAAKAGAGEIPRLAQELGVNAAALRKLGVGYTELQGKWCWTFPERNHLGWIVGIMRRLERATTGGVTKLSVKGGRRGLTYCDDWTSRAGAIWLPEGGSDVAAGLSLGLCVVGRLSNVGGIGLLVKLLGQHGARKIVVLAENDRKSALYVSQLTPRHDPKCTCCQRCFPGRAGAIQTARELAKRLHRSVGWVFPPHGHKDLREYAASLSAREVAIRLKTHQTGRFPPARPGR